MDFAIDTSTTEPRIDTRWRASKHGQDNGQPGTLDLTKFDEGTHYNIGSSKNNVIPSGVAVQFNSGTGLYEPWVAGTPAEGEEGEPGYVPAVEALPVAGFINDDAGIDLYRRAGVAKSTKAAFSLLLHGIVEVKYLPIAAQRTALPDTPFTGIQYI